MQGKNHRLQSRKISFWLPKTKKMARPNVEKQRSGITLHQSWIERAERLDNRVNDRMGTRPYSDVHKAQENV